MTVLPYTVMGQLGSCTAAFQNDNRHRGKTEAFSFHAGQSIVWIRNPRDCFAWLSALHGQGVSAVRHCPAAGQRGFRSGLLTVRADRGVRVERRAAEAARASVFRGRSRRCSGYVLRADVPYGVLQARFPESRSDNALIKSESGKNTFDGFGVNAGEEIARDVHFADESVPRLEMHFQSASGKMPAADHAAGRISAEPGFPGIEMRVSEFFYTRQIAVSESENRDIPAADFLNHTSSEFFAAHTGQEGTQVHHAVMDGFDAL